MARSRRGRGLLLGLGLIVGLAACGPGSRSTACSAYDALVDALRSVERARGAVLSGADPAAVDAHMDDVGRQVVVAKTRLAGVEADATTAAGARAMIEAANYLEFMVADYRVTGNVDFSLTQFASRDLSRATSGAGGAPLNC